MVEMLHLLDLAEVRPVVRTASSLARSSRFDLDGRVADAFDVSALTAAFAQCDIVVHAVAGSLQVVTGTLEPVYAAAERARVRRLVYLSSASVHGQAPAPGTSDDSSLKLSQPLPYNTAKVRAERKLARLRARGSVEVVVVRPGIVLGPRSFWVTSFAETLLAGHAYLINEGRGICNSIYVDNLVHALYLAMTVPGIDGQAFLVGDREQVTWLDVYRPIAEALGFDLQDVPSLDPVSRVAARYRWEAMRASRPARQVLSLFHPRLRRAVVAALTALLRRSPRPSPSPWTVPPPASPRATLEMSLLYRCDYKLPHDKATRLLGYEPIVSFTEGCRRTVGWLAFAGYPVSSNGGPPLSAEGRRGPENVSRA
jgi:2-alkyl-3-oxoalkanoate reductase